MAFFDTTWYCNFGNGTSTGYWAVPLHAASTAYTAGQIVRQFTTPAVGNERCFVCIVAGTSAAATDATWVLTRGAKTTDGTVTWIECTGATSMNGDQANTQSWAQVKAIGSSVTIGQIIKRNSGASYQVCTLSSGNTGATEPAFSDTPGATTVDGSATWTCLGLVGSFSNGGAPHARLGNVFVGGWFASGNTVYVGDNHAETASLSSVGSNSALLAKILCHNHASSYPPGASDITTGAVVSGGALNFQAQGSFYFYGIVFSFSSTILIGGSSVGQVQNWYCFDNCSLQAGGGTPQITLGASSTAWGIIVLNNTTIKISVTAAYVQLYFCQLIWQNTGPILASGSSVPTTLFQFTGSAGRFNTITLTNLDLSQLTGSLFTNAANSSIGTLLVQDCKLNAAMSVTTPINSGMRVEYLRSDSAGTSYKSQRITYEGIETTETTIVRTGGAVDPSGQAQSRKIVTSATAEWLRPYKAEPLAIWNPTAGSPVTVTVCGTIQSSALPYNDELWMEVEYLADASSTLGTIVSTTKANLLAGGSPVAVDSSVWAAFTPANLVGLIGWWDASVTASLTLNSTTVTKMADQSGAGNHLGDGVTTTNRPLYNAVGINSRPCVTLGGSNFLPCSPFPLGTGNTVTVFAVATLQTSNYGRLLSYAYPGAAHDYDTAGSFCLNTGPATTQMMWSRLNTNVALAPCSLDPAIHRMIFTMSATGAAITYIDGVATTGSPLLPGNWITGGQLALGRSMPDISYYTGKVSECGIATGFSDAATVAQLDSYLKTKWGL